MYEGEVSTRDEDYTHITVILDRTGSMHSIRSDVIGGFNAFLEEQRATDDNATLTLVQFDSQDPFEAVCDFKEIADVENLTAETYIPRASTPLLDAMGHGIVHIEEGIAKLHKGKIPTKVVVMIITDGQENASREYNKKQIEKMIKEKQEKDDWQFNFMSSDLDSIRDAGELGLAASSVLAFADSGEGITSAMKSYSEQLIHYRTGRKDKLQYEREDYERQEKAKKDAEE